MSEVHKDAWAALTSTWGKSELTSSETIKRFREMREANMDVQSEKMTEIRKPPSIKVDIVMSDYPSIKEDAEKIRRGLIYNDEPLVNEIVRIKWKLIDYCSKTSDCKEIENIINNDLIDLIFYLRKFEYMEMREKK